MRKAIELSGIWILLDSDGNYSVGTDADELTERHEKTYMPMADSWGYHIYEIKLKVRPPGPIEVDIDLTDDEEDSVIIQVSV